MSQVYMEGHLGSYINSKLVADFDTKEALRCAEEREGEWVTKSRDILQEMRTEENCPIPTPDDCANYDRTVRIEKAKIMAEAKKKVEAIFRRKSSQAVGKLGFQGEMLKFLEEEEGNHFQGAQRSDGMGSPSGDQHPGHP